MGDTMTLTLLTKEQIRARIETSLPDDDLELLASDCEDTLTKWAGPLSFDGGGDTEAVVEVLRQPKARLVRLTQEPAEITSVVDSRGGTDTTLEATDYHVRGDHLELAVGGYFGYPSYPGWVPASTWGWGDRTTVTYVPKDARYARRLALIKLIQLEINFEPGMSAQQAGPWAERYSQYSVAKQEILNEVYVPEWFA